MEAATTINKLIACYPSAKPIDLKGYITAMAEVLARYSAGIALAGLERAKLASPNFPPPIPLVQVHCEELISSTRKAFNYAAQWEAQSLKQLRERKERETESEATALRRKTAERIFAEYKTAIMKPEEEQAWKQFTAEELLATYSAKEPDHDRR